MIIAEHIGERIRFVMKSEKTKADSLRTARHCFTILLLFILAGCFSFVIGAQENGARQEMEQAREGSCGNGVNWSLDEDGVLRIYGKGEMEDYDKDKTVPWREVGSYVKSVMVEEGVTKIGRSAFYGLENLENAAAAKSVRGDSFHRKRGISKLYGSEACLHSFRKNRRNRRIRLCRLRTDYQNDFFAALDDDR